MEDKKETSYKRLLLHRRIVQRGSATLAPMKALPGRASKLLAHLPTLGKQMRKTAGFGAATWAGRKVLNTLRVKRFIIGTNPEKHLEAILSLQSKYASRYPLVGIAIHALGVA